MMMMSTEQCSRERVETIYDRADFFTDAISSIYLTSRSLSYY